MFNFNQPISKTGEHLKAFAKTLNDMVKQWDNTRMKFLEQEQRECRSLSETQSTTPSTPSTTTVKYSSDAPSTTTTTTTVAPITPAVIVNKPAFCNESLLARENPIPALNSYTRKSMTDFGAQVPRLRPLITGLWIGLNFNPYTQKGAALYNYNENVSTVAANLKLLSKEIAKMAVEWEQMIMVKSCPETEPVIDVKISANVTGVPALQSTPTSSVLRRQAEKVVKG